MGRRRRHHEAEWVRQLRGHPELWEQAAGWALVVVALGLCAALVVAILVRVPPW